MFEFSRYNSPLGEMTIMSSNNELNGLYFSDEFEKHFQNIKISRYNENPISLQTKNWLDKYFSKNNPNPYEININPLKTSFQKNVYKLLMKVPFGSFRSYGEIAQDYCRKFNRNKMSAQAIGGACKSNPILIIIPCHRILKKGNGLSGFSCGVEKKKELLNFENIKYGN